MPVGAANTQHCAMFANMFTSESIDIVMPVSYVGENTPRLSALSRWREYYIITTDGVSYTSSRYTVIAYASRHAANRVAIEITL